MSDESSMLTWISRVNKKMRFKIRLRPHDRNNAGCRIGSRYRWHIGKKKAWKWVASRWRWVWSNGGDRSATPRGFDRAVIRYPFFCPKRSGRRLKGRLMWTGLPRNRPMTSCRPRASALNSSARSFWLSLSRAACLFCLCIPTRFSPSQLPPWFFLSFSSFFFFLFLTTLSFFYVVVTFADPFLPSPNNTLPGPVSFLLFQR